jgi:hypothetical protein
VSSVLTQFHYGHILQALPAKSFALFVFLRGSFSFARAARTLLFLHFRQMRVVLAVAGDGAAVVEPRVLDLSHFGSLPRSLVPLDVQVDVQHPALRLPPGSSWFSP